MAGELIILSIYFLSRSDFCDQLLGLVPVQQGSEATLCVRSSEELKAHKRRKQRESTRSIVMMPK